MENSILLKRRITAEQLGLFQVGTEIVCGCSMECGARGVISDYNFRDDFYETTDRSIISFNTARRVTKLDKILT